jgi:Tfp pilus assembly protein PilE
MVAISVLAAVAVPTYHGWQRRARLAVLRSDLRNVRMAEEEHLALHDRYSSDVASLDFAPSAGVRLSLTSSDLLNGYSAVATHVQLPGQQCVMAVTQVGGSSDGISCSPVPAASGTLPSQTP